MGAAKRRWFRGLTMGETAARTGLNKAEVIVRRANGLSNTQLMASSRTLTSILRANFLGGFNLVIYALGTALFALGLTGDGLFSVSMILLNWCLTRRRASRAMRASLQTSRSAITMNF